MRFRVLSQPPGLPVTLNGAPAGTPQAYTPVGGEIAPGTGTTSLGIQGYDSAGRLRSAATPPFEVSATESNPFLPVSASTGEDFLFEADQRRF